MTEEKAGADDGPTDPGPPTAFLDELGAAFRRLRPQGSANWNFSDAFGRLEQVRDDLDRSGPAEAPGAAIPGAHPVPENVGRKTATGRLRLPADRNPRVLLDTWFEDRVSVAAAEAARRVVVEGPVQESVSATVEALRFLAARLERLERAADRRDGAVDGLAWLVEPPETARWLDPVRRWLGQPAGPVVVGECGAGELAVGLASAGLAVRGIEPRGSVAWAAAEAGVDVMAGEVLDRLGSVPTASLGGLVLTGVVDRAPLEGQLELLELAADRLMPGGGLAVIGTRPDPAVEGWHAVARDLLPGRPLHPETWQLLVGRAGFSEVAPLEGPPADAGVTFAIGGRR